MLVRLAFTRLLNFKMMIANGMLFFENVTNGCTLQCFSFVRMVTSCLCELIVSYYHAYFCIFDEF